MTVDVPAQEPARAYSRFQSQSPCAACHDFIHCRTPETPTVIRDFFPALPRLTASGLGCEGCALLRRFLFLVFGRDKFRSQLAKKKTAADVGAWFRDRMAAEWAHLDPNVEWPLEVAIMPFVPELVSLPNQKAEVEVLLPGVTYTTDVCYSPQANFHGGFPDPDPLSSKSVAMMKFWIEECRGESPESCSTHGPCPKFRSAPAPLRLLEVGSGDDVRLVEMEGAHLAYAALSYCWGYSEKIHLSRTTAANVAARRDHMRLSDLPRTHIDSVRVARALGIDYLWIDGLCILQDSAEDWGRESRRMMQYYENAVVTIAPISSDSADDGFLHMRPDFFHAEVRTGWHDDDATTLHLHSPGYRHPEDEIRASLWSRRAWTLQERLLSSRMLYFTPHSIAFQCRARGTVDTGAPVHARLVNTDHLNFLPSSYVPHWGAFVDELGPKWYRIVDAYSDHELSYEGDRLPALSGIVEKFAQMWDGDRALWGIWERDVSRGLLWMNDRGRTSARQRHSRKDPVAGVPTWSWVGGGCGLATPTSWTHQSSITFGTCARLERTVTRDGETQPFKLVMRGPVCSLKEVFYWPPISGLLVSLTVKLDRIFQSSTEYRPNLEHTFRENFGPDFGSRLRLLFTARQEESKIPGGRHGYWVTARRADGTVSVRRYVYSVMGIVLVEATPGSNEWARVGFVQMWPSVVKSDAELSGISEGERWAESILAREQVVELV